MISQKLEVHYTEIHFRKQIASRIVHFRAVIYRFFPQICSLS